MTLKDKVELYENFLKSIASHDVDKEVDDISFLMVGDTYVLDKLSDGSPRLAIRRVQE